MMDGYKQTCLCFRHCAQLVHVFKHSAETQKRCKVSQRCHVGMLCCWAAGILVVSSRVLSLFQATVASL